MKPGGLPPPARPSGLARSRPGPMAIYPSPWTVLFVVSLIGGAVVYTGEAYLAWSGAFPLPVLVIVGVGYVVWLWVVETSWRRRGRGP